MLVIFYLRHDCEIDLCKLPTAQSLHHGQFVCRSSETYAVYQRLMLQDAATGPKVGEIAYWLLGDFHHPAGSRWTLGVDLRDKTPSRWANNVEGSITMANGGYLFSR